MISRTCYSKGNVPWNVGLIGWKKKSLKYDVEFPYVKNCSKCDCEMKYSSKYSLVYSIRDDKLCRRCGNPNKIKNCRGIVYKRTIKIKEKNRISMLKYIEIYGIGKCSDETRQKMRISAINNIQKARVNGNQIYPRYNPKSIPIIDEYGKENGYNFQHAENGGEHHIKELGYFVDGYDEKKNVVIEIDEKRHFNKDGNLTLKDIQRQQKIENYLKCKFIRIRIDE